MAEKKDYLAELEKEANNKVKLESFQEEKIERIETKGIRISPGLIAGIVSVAIIAGVAIYFMFFRASIEMPNFIGKSVDEVVIWAKQYEVENTGIVITQEYNFDIDKGNVISQSINEGSKIKTDVKITFVESLGPDPDEPIDFPDMLSLDEETVRNWIADYKLTNTKISLVYSDTVSEGKIIEYDVKGSESSFTRGTKLTISISKGVAPAGTISIADFENKNKTEVQSWAEKNNIDLEIIKIYSDTVAVDIVISQSLPSGRTIKQGEKFSITISKGKAIKIPDFTKMSKDDYETWKADPDNKGINIVEKQTYNDDWTKYIMNQSIKANSMVDEGETIKLGVSIGLPKLGKSYIGESLQSLVDWANAERAKGSDMFAGEWGNDRLYSKTYRAGQIVSITCADANGKSYDCNGELPLDARFSVVVSKGIEVVISENDLKDSASMVNFLANNSFSFNTESITGSKSELYVNGVKVNANDYIREGSTILVKVATELDTSSPATSADQLKCESNGHGTWNNNSCACDSPYTLVAGECQRPDD